MAMECNIGGGGRWIRGVVGGLVAGGGITLLTTAPNVALFVFGMLMIFGGGFMLFEALCGWCVVRALGGETPF